MRIAAARNTSRASVGIDGHEKGKKIVVEGLDCPPPTQQLVWLWCEGAEISDLHERHITHDARRYQGTSE